METNGLHLVINAFECQNDILNNAVELEELLTKAIKQLGMESYHLIFTLSRLWGDRGYRDFNFPFFNSHMAGTRLRSVDLYTCGDARYWPALEEMLTKMQAKQTVMYSQ